MIKGAVKDRLYLSAFYELSNMPEQKVKEIKQLWVLEFMCPMDGVITQCFTEKAEAVKEYHYRYGHHYMDDVGPPDLYTKEAGEQYDWEKIS